MTENVTLEIIKTTGIIITAILSLVGLIYTVKGKNKIEAYHKEVNGKMGELLDVSKTAAKAEGNLEGRADLKQEQKSTNDTT